MRRVRTLVLLALGAAVVGGSARANPIVTELVRARQVPRTQHVQITFAWEAGGPARQPGEVQRDGKVLTPTWTPLSSYVANSGSGLRSLAATQLCDCEVPLGSHRYDVKVMGGSYPLQANVTVVPGLEPPPDGGTPPQMDMLPWDIPEPVEIRGLDCVTACAAPPVDLARAPADLAFPPSSNGGSCGLGGRGAIGVRGAIGLGALAIAILAIALRRRR